MRGRTYVCSRGEQPEVNASFANDEPGKFIGRVLRAGERTEADIDTLITRRHERRVATESERPAEEAWKETESRHMVARHAANREAWIEYYEGQAERHRAVERHQDSCYHEPQLRRGG
jgi:hypothetical protein